MKPSATRLSPGAAIYSSATLAAYDAFVLGFSCRYLWRVPAAAMLAHYEANIGAHHLDVGVGTGYLLDHCRFATPPRIALLDENAASLRFAARRLARYEPATYRADITRLVPEGIGPFDSIGINFVLHCLPGAMADKAAVLARLRVLLRPGGRLFGSTILGHGVPHTLASRTLMRLYNARGIFNNEADDPPALSAALAGNFADSQMTVHGAGALFGATA